jgi:hypothetical protein
MIANVDQTLIIVSAIVRRSASRAKCQLDLYQAGMILFDEFIDDALTLRDCDHRFS